MPAVRCAAPSHSRGLQNAADLAFIWRIYQNAAVGVLLQRRRLL